MPPHVLGKGEEAWWGKTPTLTRSRPGVDPESTRSRPGVGPESARSRPREDSGSDPALTPRWPRFGAPRSVVWYAESCGPRYSLRGRARLPESQLQAPQGVP